MAGRGNRDAHLAAPSEGDSTWVILSYSMSSCLTLGAFVRLTRISSYSVLFLSNCVLFVVENPATRALPIPTGSALWPYTWRHLAMSLGVDILRVH